MSCGPVPLGRLLFQSRYGFVASLNHVQDVQEPADLEHFAYLGLHAEKDHLSALGFESLGGNEHHPQTGTRDVVQIFEIKQKLVIALCNQAQNVVFGTSGVATIELARESDETRVGESFMENHWCKNYNVGIRGGMGRARLAL